MIIDRRYPLEAMPQIEFGRLKAVCRNEDDPTSLRVCVLLNGLQELAADPSAAHGLGDP